MIADIDKSRASIFFNFKKNAIFISNGKRIKTI